MWRGGGVGDTALQGRCRARSIARRELIRRRVRNSCERTSRLLRAPAKQVRADARYGAMLSLQHMISLLRLQALGLATATLTVRNWKTISSAAFAFAPPSMAAPTRRSIEKILRLALIGQGRLERRQRSRSPGRVPTANGRPGYRFRSRASPRDARRRMQALARRDEGERRMLARMTELLDRAVRAARGLPPAAQDEIARLRLAARGRRRAASRLDR